MTKSTILFLLFFAIFFQFGCEKDCNQGGNCDLEPNPGPCFAAISKYYFDKDDGKCKEFIWGGCNGIVPFDSLEECKECECNN